MHSIVRFVVLLAAVKGEPYNCSEEDNGTNDDSGDATSGDSRIFGDYADSVTATGVPGVIGTGGWAFST